MDYLLLQQVLLVVRHLGGGLTGTVERSAVGAGLRWHGSAKSTQILGASRFLPGAAHDRSDALHAGLGSLCRQHPRRSGFNERLHLQRILLARAEAAFGTERKSFSAGFNGLSSGF